MEWAGVWRRAMEEGLDVPDHLTQFLLLLLDVGPVARSGSKEGVRTTDVRMARQSSSPALLLAADPSVLSFSPLVQQNRRAPCCPSSSRSCSAPSSSPLSLVQHAQLSCSVITVCASRWLESRGRCVRGRRRPPPRPCPPAPPPHASPPSWVLQSTGPVELRQEPGERQSSSSPQHSPRRQPSPLRLVCRPRQSTAQSTQTAQSAGFSLQATAVTSQSTTQSSPQRSRQCSLVLNPQRTPQRTLQCQLMSSTPSYAEQHTRSSSRSVLAPLLPSRPSMAVPLCPSLCPSLYAASPLCPSLLCPFPSIPLSSMPLPPMPLPPMPLPMLPVPMRPCAPLAPLPVSLFAEKFVFDAESSGLVPREQIALIRQLFSAFSCPARESRDDAGLAWSPDHAKPRGVAGPGRHMPLLPSRAPGRTLSSVCWIR